MINYANQIIINLLPVKISAHTQLILIYKRNNYLRGELTHGRLEKGKIDLYKQISCSNNSSHMRILRMFKKL